MLTDQQQPVPHRHPDDGLRGRCVHTTDIDRQRSRRFSPSVAWRPTSESGRRSPRRSARRSPSPSTTTYPVRSRPRRRQTESPLRIEDARPRRIRASDFRAEAFVCLHYVKGVRLSNSSRANASSAIRRNLPGWHPSVENTTDIAWLAVTVLSEPETDIPIHVAEGGFVATPDSTVAFTTRLFGLRGDIVTHPS